LKGESKVNIQKEKRINKEKIVEKEIIKEEEKKLNNIQKKETLENENQKVNTSNLGGLKNMGDDSFKNEKSIILGINEYQGEETPIYFKPLDRMRHMYVIGQTGTGKTTLLKNMIVQDIKNGDGVCFIDPHGSDIEDILAQIPPERHDDVIYFDPAYLERPMGLNMLEYDARYPEQKSFVVNELLAIFNKLFDMKTSGGPMFEMYFRNAVLLTIDDPKDEATLLDVVRVLSDKEYRASKLKKSTNVTVNQF
jgi:Cdc6-like AAA superfamily ATPase